MTELLILRELSKTYQNNGMSVIVLRGINIIVNSGEFDAIMGPSGYGKSTMLNLIAGLDTPTAGEIFLADKQLRDIALLKSVGFTSR
jgi:ABC-type lipoprotein export system ATPase subunit